MAYLVLKLVLLPLDKGDIKLLAGVAALQISPHVSVIIPHDPRHQVRCGHALGPLRGNEHSPGLHRRVHIHRAACGVRLVVMRHKINLVLGHKLVVQGPGRVDDDLVDVATVAQRLVALVLVHDGLALLGVGELVVAAAHHEVHLGLGEHVLGLHHLPGMTLIHGWTRTNVNHIVINIKYSHLANSS